MKAELEDLMESFDEVAKTGFQTISAAIEAVNAIVLRTCTPEETYEFGQHIFNTLTNEYQRMMYGRGEPRHSYTDIIQ